jgi:phosphate-selective porin OprO/OprP
MNLNHYHNQRLPRFGKWAASLVVALLASTPVWGDEAAELRAQLKVLEQRIQALEKAPAVSSAASTAQVVVNRQGLVVKDKDNFSFRIRPRLQVDGHFFQDDADGTSEWYLRRLRPAFQGTAGALSWRFMPELAGTVRIIDASGELNFGQFHALKFGKFKDEVGLEALQSFSKTLFLERGLPSMLTSTRDIGLSLRGVDADQRYQWSVGLYNGGLDNTDLSANANLSKGDYDFAGRLSVSPWKSSPDAALSGLSFGLAAGVGTEHATILDSDRDRRIRYQSSGRGTFFRYQDGVAVDGRRTRINPFLTWYRGPFGLLSEYVQTSQQLIRSVNRQRVDAGAWTLQVGWVLTGEAASYEGVRPSRPLDWASGQWGAFEVGARVHALEVDEAAFAGDGLTRLAHSSAVQKALAYAAALNWYLTDNLLLALNYEVTDFSGLGADRPTEQALITRFQVDF